MAEQKDHGPQIKDDALYEDLRQQGYAKSKAAAIANASANPKMHPHRKGGRSAPYEEWTRGELYERARELEIEGRSKMNKDELIAALRQGD